MRVFPYLLFLAPCIPAHAFYVTPSTPPNWVHNAATQTIRASPADITFANGIRSKIGGAVVQAGGRAVTLPVAYRFAPAAARVAAAAAFAFPAVVAGIAIGSAAYETYKYFHDAGFFEENGKWSKLKPHVGQGFEWTTNDGFASSSAGTSCANWAKQFPWPAISSVVQFNSESSATCLVYTDGVGATSGNMGRRTVESTTMEPEPVTQTEFEDGMSERPFNPKVVPSFPFPDVDWPVEPLPIVNPSPVEVGNPEAVPVPLPLRVPVGEPQLVPNSVPETYRTPVVDIVPSPTISDPFRVDVKPQDVDKLTPEKLPDEASVPVTPDPSESVKPSEKTPGLCDLYPNILACAKPQLDIPDAPDIQRQNMDVSITPDSGWGGGGGSCPAARHIAGANVEFSFQPLCDGISKFRPLILAFAWLSAAFILVGMRQGADT